MSLTQEKNHKKVDVLGPLISIFFGVIFLLQNTGILPWEIWRSIWRFWPMLLILSGTQILLGRRKGGSLIMISFAMIVLSGVVLYALDQVSPITHSFRVPFITNNMGGDSTQTVTDSISHNQYHADELSSVDFVFNVASTKLQITDSKRKQFLRLRSTLPSDLTPLIEENLHEGSLEVEVSLRQPWYLFNTQSSMMADINTLERPTNLDIDVGTGTALLEFEENQPEMIQVDVGAGSARIDLAKIATPSGTIRLDIGVGSTQIFLPKEIEYELVYSVGVGKISLNNQELSSGLGTNGTFKESLDAEKETPLKFDISVGTGSVELFQGD